MCCNEDQAIAVSAGLYITGALTIVMVQNQGFYACVNTVRAVGLDAKLPIVMLVGQFGREEANFGKPTTASTRNTSRLLEPVMTALGVRFWNIEHEDDLASIDAAFATAHELDAPVALNVGMPIEWS